MSNVGRPKGKKEKIIPMWLFKDEDKFNEGTVKNITVKVTQHIDSEVSVWTDELNELFLFLRRYRTHCPQFQKEAEQNRERARKRIKSLKTKG